MTCGLRKSLFCVRGIERSHSAGTPQGALYSARVINLIPFPSGTPGPSVVRTLGTYFSSSAHLLTALRHTSRIQDSTSYFDLLFHLHTMEHTPNWEAWKRFLSFKPEFQATPSPPGVISRMLSHVPFAKVERQRITVLLDVPV
jgi:hypothetical protein